jgi:atypical dual specificity phosphatase
MFGHLIATSRVLYDKGWDAYNNYYKEEEEENESEKQEMMRIFPEIGTFTKITNLYAEPTHVIDNIYIGNACNAGNYNCLKKKNIGLIINMTKAISNYFPDDFQYYKYDLYDNNNDSIKHYLGSIITQISNYTQDNKDKNILVHCVFGASRSATVVIYYLINKEQMTFDKALEFLHEKRPVINPTEKFREELLELCDANKQKQEESKIKKKPIVDSIIEPSISVMERLDTTKPSNLGDSSSA